MVFKPLSPFIIVKIEKEVQSDNREKDGYFYTHFDNVFMQRERQYGEIVAIGSEAKSIFPMIKEGHTLIFHHFVSGRDIEDNGENINLIHSDEIYNYYAVTVKSHNGERNLTYGIFDGERIIPHPDFIFLDNPITVKKEESGITTVSYEKTRGEISAELKKIKDDIKELTKTIVSKDITDEIKRKEEYVNQLTKSINKKKYNLYPIAALSEKTKSIAGEDISIAGVLNIACNTKVMFMDKEYIVANVKYLSFVA